MTVTGALDNVLKVRNLMQHRTATSGPKVPFSFKDALHASCGSARELESHLPSLPADLSPLRSQGLGRLLEKLTEEPELTKYSVLPTPPTSLSPAAAS